MNHRREKLIITVRRLVLKLGSSVFQEVSRGKFAMKSAMKKVLKNIPIVCFGVNGLDVMLPVVLLQ